MGAVIALLATAGIVVPGLDRDDPPAPTPNVPASPSETAEGSQTSSVAGLDEAESAGVREVLAAIETGEPLPYSEDGGTFQNREGLLPAQPIGYYREYTVETPGSPDRGARRLVIGEAGETYYTADHYSSFTRIDPDDFAP